ncbi:uncharacterized protein BDW43DRAFT_313135 [Aspergillus alliaceus]|uniref:uncharacterized protein n=1 Tax=Petromyces alliaceus TaxID=209559 RepID=UPI0012A6E362|nr:uncharacterized protein BDW43DRAFT_313135 [Aspergillus alliaceus]KAB8231321.1 hypothetical protein BDW43DRAFT_313135 [Aspergillus alliaceus]
MGRRHSQHAPTPGYFGCTPATLYSPSPALEPGLQPDQLGFLPFSLWEESVDYDERPPKYVCYSIAWKLVLNRKTVGKVTEEDLVVAKSFWRTTWIWNLSSKSPTLDSLFRSTKASLIELPLHDLTSPFNITGYHFDHSFAN